MVIFDVETSGLSPMVHEIIEIGAVKIDMKTREVTQFQSLLKNERALSEKNMSIHGITNEDLIDAPAQDIVLKEFFSFIKGSSLVAYNAQFDVGFLISEQWKHKYQIDVLDVFDALYLARATYKKREEKPENYRLDTLKEFHNLTFGSHRALEDSIVCLKVFEECLKVLSWKAPHLKKFIIFNFKEPIDIGDQDNNELIEIKKAISCSSIIKISYKGGSKGREQRPIQPVALLPMPNCLNLYAKCLKDDQFKLFNTKKIKKVTHV